MMFQEFTWQQFLAAAMVLSALWVLGVWLIYWWFLSPGGLDAGRGSGGEDVLRHSWEDEMDELNGDNAFNALNALEADDGLMGKLVLEQGVSVLDADEFSFVSVEEPGEREERREGWEANLPLDLEEVQQEIKIICRTMEREDGSKEDFFSMFRLIRARYPRLAGSALLTELNDFIREQVPFFLSDDELDSLWV